MKAVTTKGLSLDRQVNKLVPRLGHFGRPGGRSGARSAGHPGSRPAAAAGIYQQTEHRVGHRVQCRGDGREVPERVSCLLPAELNLQDQSPPRGMPLPAPCAVGVLRLS